MAWVRYDDSFHENRKVTAVILEDPGALALHLLANTWTNAQKYPGFVPTHQPAILLCDRGLGAKWASILVAAGLWHERGAECERCQESYEQVPADLAGYVIHDARDYRAPARERQTPGTPAELSAARQEAGRKGGQSSARSRAQSKQNARANEANDVSKASNPSSKAQANGKQDDSNRVSPEPVPEPVVATDVATTPPPAGDADKPRRGRKPEDPDAPKNARAVVAAFIDAGKAAGQDPPTTGIINKLGRDAKRLLEEKVPIERLIVAAERAAAGGWTNLDIQLQRMSAERVRASLSSNPRASTTHFRNYADPDEAYKDYEEQPSEVA